jgi:hypothetical protein
MRVNSEFSKRDMFSSSAVDQGCRSVTFIKVTIIRARSTGIPRPLNENARVL